MKKKVQKNTRQKAAKDFFAGKRTAEKKPQATSNSTQPAASLVIDPKDLPEGRGYETESYLLGRVLEQHGLRAVIQFDTEALADPLNNPYEHLCLLALNGEFEPVIIDGGKPETVSVMESVQFYFEHVMRGEDVTWTDITAWSLWASLAFREVTRIIGRAS